MEIEPSIYYSIWPIIFTLLIISQYLIYTEKKEKLHCQYWIKFLFWSNIVLLFFWPLTYFYLGSWVIAFGLLIIMTTVAFVTLIFMKLNSGKRKWWYFSLFVIYFIWLCCCIYFSLFNNAY